MFHFFVFMLVLPITWALPTLVGPSSTSLGVPGHAFEAYNHNSTMPNLSHGQRSLFSRAPAVDSHMDPKSSISIINIKRQQEEGMEPQRPTTSAFSWHDFPDYLQRAGVSEVRNGNAQLPGQLEQQALDISSGKDAEKADNGNSPVSAPPQQQANNPPIAEEAMASGEAFKMTSDGHRYRGETVPDDFWRTESTWSTAPRQPLDISRKIPSVNENLDHSIQGAIKSLPWPLVKETTPQERLRSALINNGNFADGFNANMAQNAGSSKNPGKGRIKTQLAPLFRGILTKFTG
ncbi:hypothetical protein ETB97_008888 [Aspergillus alliaceus]|uniref:Uncharacterized protein n=1 Tax=Petromyces alliaceus TaxID=209559 RepID=A0A8H6E186_PETAA|nr:hypothetical protein ETB97_008888 [Aspergillus burnettii]